MEEAARANKKGETLIPTPSWFIALRVFQIVFSIIAVGMTGWWIHGLYYDELGFVIVCVSSKLEITNTPFALGTRRIFYRHPANTITSRIGNLHLGHCRVRTSS